ncbi:hypothetical protein EDB85DRAFT_1898652 [Lactarius pseudohatsudake]|nr:hypothetical protein EDB85DRAFT_1898652 [Lactarius pseudohatsudake]
MPRSCHEERTVVGIASGVIAIIIGLASVTVVPASVLSPPPRHRRRWCRSSGGCAPCGGGVAAALARCKGWWRRRTCAWRWVGGGSHRLVCCKVEAEAATGT